MTDTGTTRTMVKKRHIDAEPEVLFRFLTEPERLTRWMCSEATTDPRPGGINHQTHVEKNGKQHLMRSEFIEVEFPRLVSFTFDFLDEKGNHRENPGIVTIELAPAGSGTDLKLTHSGITDAQWNGTYGGWDTHLDKLSGIDFGDET